MISLFLLPKDYSFMFGLECVNSLVVTFLILV